MKIFNITLVTLALAVTAGCNSNLIKDDKDMSLSNKEKAVAVLNSIETGDPLATSYINASSYTQHNLGVADGLEGFGELLQQLPEDGANVSVERVFKDGDYVFAHTRYDFFGPKIGFDIFRFEEGLIVEHWDNLQETATVTVSGRSQIDGETKITDLDKTEENKALVKRLLNDVFLGANPSKITDYISTTTYSQHNPNIADGLDGLGAALAAMAQAGTPLTYTKNHIILGEGNFVLAVSEGQFMGAHTAFYDLFRIESGKVVEHWDTLESIPEVGEWKNMNGKFGF